MFQIYPDSYKRSIIFFKTTVELTTSKAFELFSLTSTLEKVNISIFYYQINHSYQMTNFVEVDIDLSVNNVITGKIVK